MLAISAMRVKNLNRDLLGSTAIRAAVCTLLPAGESNQFILAYSIDLDVVKMAF